MNTGDSIVVTKMSRIASNMNYYMILFSLIYENNIELEILDVGIISKSNDISSFSNWIDSLFDLENDNKYEKRCIGHLKKKIRVQSDESQLILSNGRTIYTTKQLVDALKLQNQYSIREISKLTGISRNTLYRAKNKLFS